MDPLALASSPPRLFCLDSKQNLSNRYEYRIIEQRSFYNKSIARIELKAESSAIGKTQVNPAKLDKTARLRGSLQVGIRLKTVRLTGVIVGRNNAQSLWLIASSCLYCRQ